ncbi:MAG: hypothetical protein GY888_22740, partial [Planctomycetaceae bacterium]|nr:hypothetical protein [Planctomycetaceae bacterium]
MDNDDVLYELIWTEFPSSIRLLLDNQFVFQPFWDFQNGLVEEEHWKKEFEQAKVVANKALAGHSTTTVLAVILSRMYTLRNQLIHGGATWNSGVNRAQVRDGSEILGFLMPVFIDIMMDNPNENWGKPFYPVV